MSDIPDKGRRSLGFENFYFILFYKILEPSTKKPILRYYSEGSTNEYFKKMFIVLLYIYVIYIWSISLLDLFQFSLAWIQNIFVMCFKEIWFIVYNVLLRWCIYSNVNSFFSHEFNFQHENHLFFKLWIF